MPGFGQNDEVVSPKSKPFGVNDETVAGSTPPERPGPVENTLSHVGARFRELPGELGGAAAHPIDTAKAMFGQQKQLAGEGMDAARSGDYSLAAARGLEALMPGVGPAIAGGFKTIKSGDTSGGIGDMIGSVGPALALRAATLSPKVRAFASGAKSAATENVPSFRVGHVNVQAPVPAPLAGAFTGAALGRLVGHPIPGGIIGALTPVLRGGMKSAAGEDWLPSAPEAIPNPFTVPSQRLLNRGGIVTPPTETSDASYVRGAPAMAYPPNSARALPSATPIRTASGVVNRDRSYVRSVPAMAQPPNPARALPSAPQMIVTPLPEDPSYVRGIDAQYPEVIQGPLAAPEAVLKNARAPGGIVAEYRSPSDAGPLAPKPTFANGGIKNNVRRK